MDFSNLNWLAIIVATIVSFAVGFVWYSVLFGKLWMKEIGMTREDMKGANMPMIFGSAFILNLIMAIATGMLLNKFVYHLDWMHGAQFGAFVGIGFVATAIGVNYLFARKSLTLFFIDAIYQVVVLVILGAIIGGWHK